YTMVYYLTNDQRRDRKERRANRSSRRSLRSLRQLSFVVLVQPGQAASHRQLTGATYGRQFGGFALGGSAQLKLSSTRRIEPGSTVFGFTSLVKSGKCSRIWAAPLIRLPVTTTRAPNTSASFAGPMTRVFVSRLSGAQSTI